MSYKVRIGERNNNVTAISCKSAKLKVTEIKSQLASSETVLPPFNTVTA